MLKKITNILLIYIPKHFDYLIKIMQNKLAKLVGDVEYTDWNFAER